MDVDYKVERTTTTTEVEINLPAGAPDTKGTGTYRITIRPERLTVRLDGGPSAPIGYVKIRGRMVRRDGTLSKYRDLGWHYGWSNDELPPEWIVDIIDREGLRWPDGIRQ